MPENLDDGEDGGGEDSHGGIGVESTKEAREQQEAKAAADKEKNEKEAQAQKEIEAAIKDAAKNSTGH